MKRIGRAAGRRGVYAWVRLGTELVRIESELPSEIAKRNVFIRPNSLPLFAPTGQPIFHLQNPKYGKLRSEWVSRLVAKGYFTIRDTKEDTGPVAIGQPSNRNEKKRSELVQVGKSESYPVAGRSYVGM